MAAPDSANPPGSDHRTSLLLVLGAGVLCVGVAPLLGWFSGGAGVARAAGAGAASAAVGGLAGWAVVVLASGRGAPVMAGPMLGLLARVVVTGVCVGFAMLGLGLARQPLLLAALFGYLVLMATESVLLYRFASSAGSRDRHTATTATQDAEQALKQDPQDPQDP